MEKAASQCQSLCSLFAQSQNIPEKASLGCFDSACNLFSRPDQDARCAEFSSIRMLRRAAESILAPQHLRHILEPGRLDFLFELVLEQSTGDAPLLWLRTIDSPFFPIPVSKLVKGARATLETIEAGGQVYVHCAEGRHRGVAMGSCILIAQGYTAEEAMQLISRRRSFADPNIYYIRAPILKFAQVWRGS